MAHITATQEWPEAPEGGYFILVDHETTVGHEATLSEARERAKALADAEILPAVFSIANVDGEHVECVERSDGQTLQDQIACFGNAETWFQARALRLAARHLAGLQVVLSYCDPVARTALDGTVTAPGHLGTTYRAGNARALGRASPRTLKLLPDGRVASERALSKIRVEDQGAAYATRLLVDSGAPARLPMESGADYLQRIDAAGFFRRVRHPGNLVFGWDVRRFSR